MKKRVRYEQIFHKENIHVANRHMKKYIISHKRYKELQRDIQDTCIEVVKMETGFQVLADMEQLGLV